MAGVKIWVDGKTYEVEKGDHLLRACLTLGLDLPYFCWHPALGSVGACRQCAVKQFKDEEDTQGRLVMACMTPAQDGTRISLADPEARDFRARVIEWMMTNHPHDCPICDEGGHCHLQDMTVMTGHAYRRHRFRKRTFRNQYLGPFLNHEMNRCITCYRCVRFYRDYAGGKDLNAFAAHHHVYFGRHEDGVLESELSGNLAEVCPTGVFTDKTLKEHYTRKWDLSMAPSVCVHCSLGCNTIVGERYGELRCILNRYHHDVNGYFLCDRGRFGWGFVNDERRVRTAMLRTGAGLEPAGKEAALEAVRSCLERPEKVLGIGSPRASLEANFALQTLVGPERFCSGMAKGESELVERALDILRQGSVPVASLRQARESDAVLVLGEDVSDTAPILALALRQSVRQQPMQIADQLGIDRWHDAAVREAVQEERGPLFLATVAPTRLDGEATEAWHGAPADIARLGFAVAGELDASAPGPEALPPELRSLAQSIAKSLRQAERPLVISGTGAGTTAVLEAAANVAWALADGARLGLVVPECNSLGAALLGRQSLEEAHRRVSQGEVETLIILENDLYRRAPRPDVDALLDKVQHLVVVDHLRHATAERAEVVLPAATFAEGDGTLVNNEGRAQRFFQVFVPGGDIQESWRWLRDAAAGSRELLSGWENLDAVCRALAEAHPELAAVAELTPPAGFRLAGARIPREPHRYSGRTAMRAHLDVHEPKPPDDPDSPLAFSMEGARGQIPPSLIPFHWAPAWNSVQATAKFQAEVGGRLRGGDPGRRLIEADGRGAGYYGEIPSAFASREEEWLVVPRPRVFGTEELSMGAPAIRERAGSPHALMSSADAERLGLAEGDEIEVSLEGHPLRISVEVEQGMPDGLLGVPVGWPGVEWVALPAWGRVSKA